MSVHEVKTANGVAYEVRWRETDWSATPEDAHPVTGVGTFPERNRSFRVHHLEAARHVDRELVHALNAWNRFHEAPYYNRHQDFVFRMHRAFRPGEPIRNMVGEVMTAPARMNVPENAPPSPREAAKATLAEWRLRYEPDFAAGDPELQALYHDSSKSLNDVCEFSFSRGSDEDREALLAFASSVTKRMEAAGVKPVELPGDAERFAKMEARMIADGYTKAPDGGWIAPAREAASA